MIDLRIDANSYGEIVAASKEDDIFCIFSQSPEDGMQQIREALSGRHDSIRTRLIERLREKNAKVPLTRIAAALLAHRGVDPVAVAALLIHSEEALLLLPEEDEDDDATCFAYISRDFIDRGHVQLSPGTYWRMHGGIDTRVPHVLRSCLLPGPLSHIVTHPVLDPMELSVREILDDHEDDVLLVLGGFQGPMTLDELITYRPRPA